MRTTTLFAGFVLGASLVTGCIDDGSDKPDQSNVKGGPDGKAEAWGSADNPALFNSSLDYVAANLPRTGEARNIPWAGNYWPVYQDSINHKWAGSTSEAPSTKYGRAFNVTGVENAVSQYHGVDNNSDRTACTTDSQCNSTLGESCAKREGQTSGRCIPTWWGICHAWSPAAILLPEPKHAVTYGGVDFKVQDIKALLTLVHDRTETKFVSLRCDKLDNGTDINFDKYGRPNTGSAECRDTNPGTFHVLMTNYLGKQGESFVYDRTFDSEVWNQPLRGYRITEMTEVSALDANKLVGVTAEGGTTTTKTGNVAQGATTQVGTFPVQAGQLFTLSMTGTGDPDVYVKFGSAPTTSSYDCRPYVEGAAETCTLTVPAGATQAFVAVNGYTASTYSMNIVVGGSIPSSYVFNTAAAKLFKTHMDVDYISESPASQDGNLGATIDRYTHTDNYDYILEVDAAGKIVGGEWLGASKRKHPDFVWLPIRASGTSVAGGKITYANVKMIYDLSMQDAGGGTTGGGVKTVTDSATVAKAAWKQYGPFNVAAGTTLTATMTGSAGDADLYVRKGAAPTMAAYDCRPYTDGSNESCSIVGPAQVYVGVNGYATSSAYGLTIKYTEGGGTTPPSPPPTTFTHLSQTGSVAQGEMKVFQLAVPANKRLVIRTTSTVDVDLYIQFGAAPTTDAYIARGYTTSGNETISYTSSSNGTLFIGVHGYAAGAFSVRTADQ
ncbi:MAG TPA: pre-peptidase C-terminal domain-containing protein [Kofleriaceae bacterium]|nr:pre-peptidase C-terminal domain-containing protein [Kofleriaceae bacterium]